ncbi:hypothetical protein DACRYDRAFT_115524, partial [Dacryopinax primogenitus]
MLSSSYQGDVEALQEAVHAARICRDKLSQVRIRSGNIRSATTGTDPESETLRTLHKLEDTMTALFVQLDELRNRVLSPMTRLHDELLQEIFVYCVDVRVPHPNAWLQWDTFDPVILTHVCHQWRTVALNTPVLWSKITLQAVSRSHQTLFDPWHDTILSQDDPTFPQSRRRYNEFIRRAKTCGLRVKLNFIDETPEYERRLTNEFCRLAQCNEIISLRLFTAKKSDDNISTCLEFILPRLQKLEIYQVAPPLTDLDPPDQSITCDKLLSKEWPRLRQLEFRGISLPTRVPLVHAPLPNLRTLKIILTRGVSDNISKLFKFIGLCNTSLERLDVCCGWDWQIEPDTEMALYLPRIEQLELSLGSNPLISILQRIRAPSLKSLGVRPTRGAEESSAAPAVVSALEVFIGSSRCRLETACILGISVIAWKKLAELSPDIRSMTVHLSTAYFSANEEVINLTDDPLQFSKLEEIHDQSELTEQSLRMLLSFVQSRRRLFAGGAMVRPIRCISLRSAQARRAPETQQGWSAIQKELADLIEELIIGPVKWNKATGVWTQWEGSTDEEGPLAVLDHSW